MELCFDIMFYQTNVDAYKLYEHRIKQSIANILSIPDSLISLQEKKEEHLYRGELASNIFRFVGSVRFITYNSQDYKLMRLITEYCQRRSLDTSLISFNSSVFNDFPLLRTYLRSLNTRQLHSFAFGTLLQLKQFVPHIRLCDKDAIPRLANMNDIWCERIEAKFEHYKRRLLIEVKMRSNFRFILEYSSINYIVISKIDDFWAVYLILSSAPLLYEKSVPVNIARVMLGALFQGEANEDGADEENEEEADTKVKYTKAVRDLRRMTLPGVSDPTVFTKSNVLELQPFSKLDIDPQKYFKQIWEIVSNINRYAKTPVYVGKITQTIGSLGNVELSIPLNLPFNVHYACQCLQNASFQLHDELFVMGRSTEFMNRVKNLCRIDAKATEGALFDLFWIKDNSIPVDSFYALKLRFDERRRFAPFETKHEHLVEVRRCILTPSRIILLPPLPYQKSKLLRMTDPDLSLRVYAKDDNFNELSFTVLFPGTPAHTADFLRQYLLNKLTDGIDLKDRKYEYLGSSTSQLRDIGMTFYCSENGSTASKIREDIGDLSNIKCPAKYISRLGQVFSQPIAYLEHIDTKNVSVVSDITGGHNLRGKPYVFSEGVGIISKKLAVELTALVDKDRLIPYSAFQIRHGGSKGMVTLNPNLRGLKMILRNSMKKFESPLTSIEVVKVSGPRYVHLNRPFVNILEQLGVESSVFLTLARKDFQLLIDSFSCKCKALEIIKHYSLLNLDFEPLRDGRIDILGEMFFRKILETVIKNTIKLVKSNARIRLPDTYGRTMLGVLDETGLLEENEIFAQYSSLDYYMDRKVVIGEVLVTKFPCMHPGDVRKFMAVDVPELHHICDCLVFPQKGSRPHPDQMAGSDLDGDEYAIIWEKSLIFPGPNQIAMDYPSGGAVNHVNQVGVKDMLQFYVDFIQKNNVGTLANSNLALSDFYREGIFHPQCILLAEQHPIALDYAKSGEINTTLSPRALYYPDFMEKIETKPTYKSKRALGKLYRLTCMFEENSEFDSILGEQICGNEKLLTYPGWKKYEVEAENMYERYKCKILQIQRQFGIEDELSLLSGVYAKIQKYLINKNERNDVLEMINLLVKDVKKEFLNLFYIGINDDNSLMKQRRKMAKASAWYLVTRRLNADSENPYYGLPWIVSNVLCEIAKFNTNYHIPQHECLLESDVYALESIELPKEFILKMWLKNSFRNFRGFQLYRGVLEEKYLALIYPILVKLRSVIRTDITVQRVMKQLAVGVNSGDEFENMLALSASMTLRRFRQTKKFDSFTDYLNAKDSERDTCIICLSMKNEVFRSLVQKQEKIFFKKLKESGIEDISIHVNEGSHPDKSLLFVSAFGKRECLKRLKNALTRLQFYKEIVLYTSLKFE